MRLRDALCADPALVEQYVARKRVVLASGVVDADGYNRGKEAFIRRVLGRSAAGDPGEEPDA